MLTVTNGNDSGPGSLRQAIAAAASGDTITFADGVATVMLTSDQLTINDNLTIDGGDGVIIERSSAAGTPAFRIFALSGSDTEVTLNRLTIRNGLATGIFPDNSGGGIYNDGSTLTVENSTLSGNIAIRFGGSISNSAGNVLVTNSTLSNNEASFGDGGGINTFGGTLTVVYSTISGNGASLGGGGGITSDGGEVTVSHTTLSDNTATFYGGGINNIGGTLTVINSTLSGNMARIDGGGIMSSGSEVMVVSSTIYANTADSDGDNTGNGGGIRNSSTGTLLIANAIVAGNTANTDDNVSGNIATYGANLTIDDPHLGSLADNGGPTLTHLPQDGSPAIDAGNTNFLNESALGIDFTGDSDVNDTLTRDQRGYAPRIVGNSVDIGAVEVGEEPVGLLYLPLVQR
jgi:hypothetical protein